MAEIRSQLEIVFFRTREGKPPFKNAEANQPRRVAEIFAVGAFMKSNNSKIQKQHSIFSKKMTVSVILFNEFFPANEE